MAAANALNYTRGMMKTLIVSDIFGKTYGSQIRSNRYVEPRFPIDLIFLASESHFSVNELIANLTGTDNVSIRQVPFLHGFMNQHSENYDQSGYNQEIKVLRKNVI
ncbi:hypothetical protein FM037_05740 [Shewanella psychropiezotolerans]|uniref:Uncharacterized protein n=1 Tax=Shewanella psychropiezotolerans TaxID=2593655 RepID=A0ABX5WUP9_9GAMM|nr:MULTISPECIES: hypothetical protein [Shewanella]QDO82825.1 hypothetical protein FM037_05740 [Shewanella psychropiezotolerans]